MHATVSGHIDIEHVGSWIQIEVKRRSFVENAVVDHDLRTFGLSFDADNPHTSVFSVPEDFLELAARGAYFVSASQRLERQVQVRSLSHFSVDRTRLVEISGPSHNNGMSAGLVQRQLRRSQLARVFAIDEDHGASGRARD